VWEKVNQRLLRKKLKMRNTVKHELSYKSTVPQLELRDASDETLIPLVPPKESAPVHPSRLTALNETASPTSTAEMRDCVGKVTPKATTKEIKNEKHSQT
jgi:hypothetical protein